MKAKDVGMVLLALVFLWVCILLRLHRYGQNHSDAFKEFLTANQCYAARRKVDPLGRKYTEYLCENPADNVDLYDMSKGPGEK